ncbi:MAG: hypothetical protein H8K03_21540 [Nitrospira sp.]
MPYYKGHQLEAIVSQEDDGQWTGHHVIVAYAETMTDGNKGHADGRYATREAAEAAALHEGQRVLDARPPLA